MDTSRTATTEPAVVTRTAQVYIGVSGTVTIDDLSPVAGRMPELFAHLATLGVAPAGAPFLRYRRIDMQRELLVEAGVPVADPVPVAGDVVVGELPAGEYASSVYVGRPDGLIAASAALLNWVAQEGLRLDVRPSPEGDVWGGRIEVYHSDPREGDGDSTRVEMAFRLAGPDGAPA